jgi:hypothetical protein
MGRPCGRGLIDADKPLNLLEHIGPQDRHGHHSPQRATPPVIPGTNKQIGLIPAASLCRMRAVLLAAPVLISALPE